VAACKSAHSLMVETALMGPLPRSHRRRASEGRRGTWLVAGGREDRQLFAVEVSCFVH